MLLESVATGAAFSGPRSRNKGHGPPMACSRILTKATFSALLVAISALACSKTRDGANVTTAASARQSRAATPALPRGSNDKPPLSANCAVVGGTQSVVLFEEVATGKAERRESITLFPLSDEMKSLVTNDHRSVDGNCSDLCTLVAARADLNGDGREDIMALVRANPGSSGDYLWFAAANCGKGHYRFVLTPMWVRRVDADIGGARSAGGWLDLRVTQSSEGFKYVERFRNSGTGYVSTEMTPPKCPIPMSNPAPFRLRQHDKGWFLVPHPAQLGIARIVSRPDLNGDGIADLLLDFPTQCTICPKGAYVGCGGDWYVEVFRPRPNDGFADLLVGPKDESGWSTLIGVTQPAHAKPLAKNQTIKFAGGLYGCPPHEMCGAAIE